MPARIALLAAFAEALASRQSHLFEQMVKAAYAAGASREELHTAVEVGRCLAEVPGPVVSLAHANVRAWHWMATRRLAGRGDLALQNVPG
jgi:alkylhydroperoxidase/carboxymuconolactone decarboxylase family protein YurZ